VGEVDSTQGQDSSMGLRSRPTELEGQKGQKLGSGARRSEGIGNRDDGGEENGPKGSMQGISHNIWISKI